MSGGRQHVSDAAWEVMGKFVGVDRETFESWHDETVLLTVAEHDELLALRAEVERLTAALDEEKREHRATIHEYSMAAQYDLPANERLRKGQGDGPRNEVGVGLGGSSVHSGGAGAGGGLFVAPSPGFGLEPRPDVWPPR